VYIIQVIQKRANLLKYENLMALQLDPYVAMRESYIARRNAQYQKLNNE
jgi:ABC-type transporter lipoprotein component MlaA